MAFRITVTWGANPLPSTSIAAALAALRVDLANAMSSAGGDSGAAKRIFGPFQIPVVSNVRENGECTSVSSSATNASC